MNNKNKKIHTFIQNGFFVNLIKSFSQFFHSQITSSKTAQIFTSYDRLSRFSGKSFFLKLLEKVTPQKKKVLSVKKTVSKQIETSRFSKIVENFGYVILGAKLKAYGVIFLVLGLLASGIGTIEKFVLAEESASLLLLLQGAAFILLSIPLLISKLNLSSALVTGRITGFLIGFIGFKKEHIDCKATDDNMAFPVLFGVLLGVLSVLIPPAFYILALLALIYIVIVFKKPEFSVIVTVSTLPFLPTMVICTEIIITFISFILKVVRGKRSFKFDLLDAFVLIFAIILLLGGVFSVTPSESIPPACVFLCFMMAYFLIVNLIKTKEQISKLLILSLAAFALCSLYGIYQNFFAAPDTTWTDEDMFSEIETRVVSTFENPNVFGEYLIMLIPLAFTVLLFAKGFYKCVFSFGMLAISGLALIYTWSRGAWIGCILAFLIFFIIVNRNAIGIYLLSLIAVPISIPILPDSIVERFSSIGNMTDSSTSYRVFIWEASLNMIRDFFFTGIGVGTTAFQTVYSEYALSGIETAPHAHNLYLQLMIELGVFGFAVFVFTMFLFFAKVFTFLRDCESREARLTVGAISCGLLAILAQGLTDYVWYNYRVFGFFWMLLATAVAAVNMYKQDDIKQIMM